METWSDLVECCGWVVIVGSAFVEICQGWIYSEIRVRCAGS